jgi:hypothetical protein
MDVVVTRVSVFSDDEEQDEHQQEALKSFSINFDQTLTKPEQDMLQSYIN